MNSWSQRLLKLLLALLVAVGLVLVYLNAHLSKQFDSLSWAVGAKIFARPLELYQGAPFNQAQVVYELRLLNYQQVETQPSQGQFRQAANALVVGMRGHRYPDGVEPDRLVRIAFDARSVLGIQTVDAASVDIVRFEPAVLAQLSGTHADRELVSLTDLPPSFVPMLLNVEDRDFYQHQGISVTGIARALINNVLAGRFAQGGSTLTQQLVKNLYLTRERTLTRKAVEAVYAILLDANFEKEAILRAYINEVFLGQWGNRAIHGFGTASQFYFGRPISELSTAQQALLIGLIKGPSAFNPRRYPERALERRNLVLRMAMDAGLLTPNDAANAMASTLSVPENPADRIGRFPGYVALVRRELTADYSSQQLTAEGLSIYTALDPQVHRGLTVGRAEMLVRMKDIGLDPSSELQLGALVVDLPTGEIQAVLAGRHDASGFHRALDARRQIGSLAKPFVVAAALEEDPRLHAGSLVRDEAITLTDERGQVWAPKNYDETEAGVVRLENVVADSVNQATVHLAVGLGIDAILDRMGNYGLPIGPTRPAATVLGVSEMSPFAVAGVYQALLNQGHQTPLKAVRVVVDGEGRVLSRKPFASKRIFPAGVAVQVDHMMRVGAEAGTGRAFGSQYPEVLASKTGTTDDGRDAWFVGADGRRLGVSWIGFDDNRKGGLIGSVAALPVIREAFAEVQRTDRPNALPDSLKYGWLGRSGELVGEGCPDAQRRPIPIGYADVPAGECQGQSGRGSQGSWLERWFGG
jgi:penicillin-binding protein 1B